jgi:hypothetical protein
MMGKYLNLVMADMKIVFVKTELRLLRQREFKVVLFFDIVIV